MKKSLMALAALLLVAAVSGCAATPYKTTRFTLNTTADITLWGSDEKYTNDAFDIITKYEKLLSRTDENSEIYKINTTEGAVTVSKDTARVISEGLKYYALTNGAFDISLGAVTELWDFDKGTMPQSEDIKLALQSTGAGKIAVSGNCVDSGGTKIDLGAIAKGYIADKVVQFLHSKKVENAVINLGGNVTVMGKSCNVGIKRPFSYDETVATVKVKNTNIVTSGVYERCFMKEGKLFHHILDAKTGAPVETDLLSATVICKDGAGADALSTCCVLLGESAAKTLIESIKGAEAVFVNKDYKVTATKGIVEKNGIYELE